MSAAQLACLILAGGKGTRMRSRTPKLLHEVLGRPLLGWSMAAVEELAATPTVVIVPPDAGELEQLVPGWATTAVQEQARGTGDAAMSARGALGGFEGDVLVLNADHPLVDAGTLRELVDAHRSAGAAVTVLTFERTKTIGDDFGRIVRDPSGKVERIVELRDADAGQREIREVNAGYYVFRSDALWPALDGLRPDNDQGELYITDAVGALAAAGGVHAHVHERHGHPDVETIGNAIGGEDDRRIAHQLELERRFDQIAFKGRGEMRPVWRLRLCCAAAAAIGVLDVELHLAAAQVQPLQRVVHGVLIFEAQAHLATACGQRALGERGAKTVAAARQRAQRRVDRVRETA